MTGWIADFKHAIRVYLSTPAATTVAVLALAVAIAFVSAFLSLWNDLALQPHPGFEDSGALVTVAMSNGDRMAGASVTLLEDISENVNLVEGVATDQLFPTTVQVGTESVRAQGELVVARYFPLLKPRLALGRGFEAADHALDAEPVIVLGYDFWQRHFGGRPDVVGEQLGVELRRFAVMFEIAIVAPGVTEARESLPAVEVRQHRIVGVMAPSMKGTFQQATELWLPFEPVAAFQYGTGRKDEQLSVADLYERAAGLTGVGRLARGANVATLDRELARRYTAEAYPAIADGAAQGMHLTAIAGVHLDLKARREGLRQVKLFLGGTVLLALVAGLNASLFLLSRAPGRIRELAIRTALGATARRLVRQLVSEAFVLVSFAAAAGYLVSLWLVVFLRDLPLFATVRWRDVSPLDWRVLGLLAACTLLLATIVALAPVLGLRRVGIAAASRRISARAGWAQRLASAAQLAAAAVLGSVAIAFGWQLAAYYAAGPGFDLDGVVVVREQPFDFGPGRLPDFEALAVEGARRRDLIRALPGVTAVTGGSGVPGELSGFTFSSSRAAFAPTSTLPNPEESVEAQVIEVETDFPEFLGLRLVDGRYFDASDYRNVLVNETAARLLWGRTDVAGEPFGLPFRGGDGAGAIVAGVLADVYFGHPKDGMQPSVFMSTPSLANLMLVRTSQSPSALRRLLADRIDRGELELEIDGVVSLRSVWNRLFATDRARALLTAGAALLTVLLAAIGSYGTQHYVVSAGRREYAIRAAVGAGPKRLGRLVTWRGIVLALPGVAVGTALAFITVSALSGDYFSAATSPPLAVTAVTAAALLALVAGAIRGPARRARNRAPAPVLRED